jgi:hypothetical protein
MRMTQIELGRSVVYRRPSQIDNGSDEHVGGSCHGSNWTDTRESVLVGCKRTLLRVLLCRLVFASWMIHIECLLPLLLLINASLPRMLNAYRTGAHHALRRARLLPQDVRLASHQRLRWLVRRLQRCHLFAPR